MNLIHFIKFVILHFISLSWGQIIVWSALLIAMFSALYTVIIMPIIFNYFIIPKIEKNIGRKLEFNYYYNYFLFGNFSFRGIEIFTYMFVRFIFSKINPNYKWKQRRSALAKVDYDVTSASKFEIVLCLFSMGNVFFGVISMIIVWYMRDVVLKN